MGRFYARSASDRTDDWPFWFVADADRDGLNVTNELIVRFVSPTYKRDGLPFLTREASEALAAKAQEAADA